MGIVYISGPMSSLPEEEYRRNFNNAERFYQNLDYIVVNPVRIGEDYLKKNPKASYDELLENDLVYLRKCTHIALLEGYEHSNGCKVELQEAKDMGLQVIYHCI